MLTRNLVFYFSLLASLPLFSQPPLPSDSELRSLVRTGIMEENDASARAFLFDHEYQFHPIVVELILEQICQLESPHFRTRQNASLRLYRMGDLGLETLRRFETSSSAEVRQRVQMLLASPDRVIRLSEVLTRVHDYLEQDAHRSNLVELQKAVGRSFESVPVAERTLLIETLYRAVGRHKLVFGGFSTSDQCEAAKGDLKSAEGAVLSRLAESLRASSFSVGMDADAILISLPNATYRVWIEEWSFRIAPHSEPTALRWTDFFQTDETLSNGRVRRITWDNGMEFDPSRVFSVHPHITWVIGEPPSDPLSVRYLVRSGDYSITTTGDTYSVGRCLAEGAIGYDWRETSRVVDVVRDAQLRFPTRKRQ
jgi:hypothetical protein